MGKFCTKCGKPIQDNIKFCPHCGAAVETVSSGQASSYQPVSSAVNRTPSYQSQQRRLLTNRRASRIETKHYFSITGRISRKTYVKRFLILMAISIVCHIAFMLDVTLISVLALCLVLILCVSSIMLAVRRFHDVGKSGFYWLLFLVPVANIFALYLLFGKNGMPRPNAYGEVPLE